MKMRHRWTHSPLMTAAVLVGTMESHCARAQTTPGAIPDPGTYQGSMHLQQEQDRQTEQNRQQGKF
jgi:hypothetical protein